MPSLSEDLRFLSVQLMKLSQASKQEDEKDYETVYGYYYSKGALDYRDKLLELIGGMPKDRSIMEAYYALLETHPDDYYSPSS